MNIHPDKERKYANMLLITASRFARLGMVDSVEMAQRWALRFMVATNSQYVTDVWVAISNILKTV